MKYAQIYVVSTSAFEVQSLDSRHRNEKLSPVTVLEWDYVRLGAPSLRNIREGLTKSHLAPLNRRLVLSFCAEYPMRKNFPPMTRVDQKDTPGK